MPPKDRHPQNVQRVIVEVNFGTRNGKYRLEKPKRPQPKWKRNSDGRLVSNLPSRPNLGGRGDLECFYHVKREDGEVLPPPQALWTQRQGDGETVSYRPVWDQAAGNLTDALRRRSQDSDISEDFNGKYGLPYLFVYDEDVEPDEQGQQYRRWRPLQVLANGGYGVVITYVDETRGFTADDEIGDDDKIVAKFNYREGDLVGILASVISDIGVLVDLLSNSQGSRSNSQGSQQRDGQAGPSGLVTPPASSLVTPPTSSLLTPPTSSLVTPTKSSLLTPPTSASKAESASPSSRVARRAVRRLVMRAEIAGKIRKLNKYMARSPLPTARSRPRAARSGRRSSGGSSHSSAYLHLEKAKPEAEQPKIDSADTFRMENQVLQMLEMTGSPHFPRLWKLADPPQDGTLCTMGYIPGARTLAEQLDLLSNEEVPIRLMWETMLCLSKALSVMAYGSEDPAPSHRVHGWNQIVHLDWSAENIFVRLDQPSHTCSHRACFMVGDFGFALVVPTSPKARAAFRLEHLELDWHKEVNDFNADLPEAQIDTKTPLQQRIDHPIIGHFSYKTNIFCLAAVLKENLGDAGRGRTGHKRYTQDNLTKVEEGKLDRNLRSHLPTSERLGKPLVDNQANDDEDEDNNVPQLRGYLDVAESLIALPVVQDLRVSKQRFMELIERCLEEDPEKRPEIEEIMLSAARGMAEAGIYIPPPPGSDSSAGSDGGDGR